MSPPHTSAAAARGDVTVAAVWSRSAPPTALAADLGGGVVAASGEDGLAAILADPAVDAVLSVLPVQAMPAVTARALAAGKAVLQEKPVAPTVEAARALIKAAAAHAAALAVAENYRSEPGVAAAAAEAAAVGPLTSLSLVANMPMDAGNRYFASAWRRDAVGCPGTFLMDSSVHFVAALRAVAGAAGAGEAVRAGAVARRAAPDALPPPADTLAGWVEFASGVVASVSISFAGAVPVFRLTADGARGAVELSRGGFGGGGRGGGYDVAVAVRGGGDPRRTHHPFNGLEAELAAFARVARGAGTPADVEALAPEAAAADLAVVEALLASAAGGGGGVEVGRG